MTYVGIQKEIEHVEEVLCRISMADRMSAEDRRIDNEYRQRRTLLLSQARKLEDTAKGYIQKKFVGHQIVVFSSKATSSKRSVLSVGDQYEICGELVSLDELAKKLLTELS